MRIRGLGHYLPERQVPTEELAARYDVDADFFVRSTGIRSRRFAADGEGTASMGALAGESALKDAGWRPREVDLLLFCTLSPEHLFPGSGSYAQALLKTNKAAVMDIRNQCSGFIYGLATAYAYLQSGLCRKVLLVCAETQSRVLTEANINPNVAMLFGDGAGAICLETSTGERPWHFHLGADGTEADALKLELFDTRHSPYISEEHLRQGKHHPQMDGARVFLKAVSCMAASSAAVLAAAGRASDEVDLVVPHQANQRIIDTLGQRLKLSSERIFSNIGSVGNTTAASIPIALAQARDAGRFKAENSLLLTAFGSGFSWGSAFIGREGDEKGRHGHHQTAS